eukprot:COSAG01_NODE_6820_length_3483_cov_21.635638_2_plen_146_part_00
MDGGADLGTDLADVDHEPADLSTDESLRRVGGAHLAVQHYGASVLTGASLVACHELGGFLGGCSAPGLSDLLGAARCAHAAAAFCVLGAVAFLSLRQLEPEGAMASDPALPPARRIAIFGLFALAGVGLHGVKALAGLHVARIAP